jgi:hypothetical protein
VRHDLHREEPDRLDRLIELHMPALDLGSRRRGGLRDIARRHRAVKLARFARLPDDDKALALEMGGLVMRRRAPLGVARLENGALALEAGLILIRRAQRLLLRQKIVARIAVLDLDRLAHIAEPADALEKDDVHRRASYFNT